MGFEVHEAVLDLMAVSIGFSVEGLGLLAELLVAFAGDGHACGSVLLQRLAEAGAVEAFVPYEVDVLEGFEHSPRGGLVVPVARGQNEGTQGALLINSGQELGGHAAAREPDGLICAGALAALKPMLVELDIAAIDVPEHALGLLCHPLKHRIPDAQLTPAAKLGIDRRPLPKSAR